MSALSLNSHVYETRSATASMPRGDVGQLTFFADGKRLSFQMPRNDIERLWRRMKALLRETPRYATTPLSDQQ